MAERDDVLAEEEESEINLTPMLDVTFIMLIFFIVTAVFVKEPGVDVTRPEATTAITPEHGSIYVAITPSDEVWIDGDQVDMNSVRGELDRLKAENPEGGVVIEADQKAHNQILLAVMDAAKQAGITEITIAAGENNK
jgi:biopolymer transport protein ExbD